jgi:hypothetical protein
MRKSQAFLGTILACTLCFVGGDSRVVRGDAPTPSAAPPAGDLDPFEPYALGPGAIPYEAMSTRQQDEVDTIQANTDFGQKADGVASLTRATAETNARAKAEVSARTVGLESTEQDGVVP